MLRFIACLAFTPSLTAAGWIQPVWIEGAGPTAPTVVLIGGLSGKDGSSAAIDRVVKTMEAVPKAKRRINVAAIPIANPDGAELSFPPSGTAYRQNAQSHFIWRWLGLHAPDLVILVGDRDFGLSEAIEHTPVADVGSIPCVRVPADPQAIMHAIPHDIRRSVARATMESRLARTPYEVAEELSKVYGHEFAQPVYIPAMALIGRVRLGQQKDVEEIVAPYVNGTRNSLANATASHLAGHLIFAELAERTADARYIERVRAAADLAFTESGEMREAMPMNNEMSDAVFMACPILACAGKLTGKTAYFDMTVRHLRFMRKLCLRSDGLYRHSPLNDAAWGRGNAFPALGVSWALLKMPRSHPGYEEMLRDFKDHLSTLARFQDRDGMWHEIIDRPDSYAEFSATAMIATAMLRGVANGWLDESYRGLAQAAWRGILARIGPGGALVDVCESTGKQKSAEDYLARAASFGKDARGGGMALLLATEMGAAMPSR